MVAGILDAPSTRELTSPAPPDARLDDAGALRRAVLAWWRSGPQAARDALPWRSTREPWAVLVSEMMLAQTTVERVAARYGDFLERFPSPGAMAEVPRGEVLRAWSGLGYNRRAAHLHALAVRVVDEHDGVPPRSLAALLALPGVGQYTARAVLCFAHDEAIGVVDTNVGRVLARAVAGRRLNAGEAQALADWLVPRTGARRWGLALMDLGSLCCRARRPLCASCPIGRASLCRFAAQRAEDPEAVDPALGSAGCSTHQGPFAGSDRELRGRLLRAACAGPLSAADVVALAASGEALRLARLAARLENEGLLAADGSGGYRLP